MKSFRIFLPLFILTLFYSCQNDISDLGINSDELPTTRSASLSEGVKIAILSDIHVMDQSLLVKDGPAFQAYLNQDPKLLEFSSEILEVTVNDIIAKNPDLVLIPGDLTKDGERISHENVARILRQFTLHGIKVLIAPGNHDANNPDAARYINEKIVQAPTVQADRIPQIYAKFGYNDAIYDDPNTLSYVSEPIDGLWIITIDANKFYQNTTRPIGSGEIRPLTLAWIKDRLEDAQSMGKTVIGMMHHGLVEHYNYQQMVDPGYVIDNWETVSNELIDAGLKLILTGHYHATDITKREHDGKFVFDVETGSTVNYPCTYRMLTIDGNEYSFAPQNTTSLMGGDFDDFARLFMSDHLNLYFANLLHSNFAVDEASAAALAPLFTPAAMAHFAGDEVMPAYVADQITMLNSIDLSGTLGAILYSLWNDINTTDNSLTINMETGAVY